MIDIKIERYWNDYHCRAETKSFANLTELEDWMFGQMQQEYSKGMHFPTPEAAKRINVSGPWAIEIRPTRNSEDILIHMIQSSKGILFTDGKYTNMQTHWSKEVQDWLVHCKQRAEQPTFNFVD